MIVLLLALIFVVLVFKFFSGRKLRKLQYRKMLLETKREDLSYSDRRKKDMIVNPARTIFIRLLFALPVILVILALVSK